MFTRTLIATALVIAAGASFAAGEASYEYPQTIVSTVSRADVQAETLAASKAGRIAYGEQTFVAEVTMGASALSRAQVNAELAEARRLGLVGGGERNLFPTPQQNEQIRMAGLKAGMPMVASR